MTPISCPGAILETTISLLRRAGAQEQEAMLLWLASAGGSELSVVEAYMPEQIAGRCWFEVPPPAMRALMGHLRQNRLRGVAQVHSHPGRAFHSDADDEWAIVRHEGALSIVVPDFAEFTTAGTFFRDTATYRLSRRDRWRRVAGDAAFRVVSASC
jgi:hypothetical protein